jgi:hypothetical protein
MLLTCSFSWFSHDFCPLPTQFCCIVIYIWMVESRAQIADRYAHWKIANGAEDVVLQALQLQELCVCRYFAGGCPVIESRSMLSRPVCPGIKQPFGAYEEIFITRRQLRACSYGALSLTRGWICRLQLSLVLASAVNSWVRVPVPWDSWPCFTVSDSRLPFSSHPTTRTATVEVFEPAPCLVMATGSRYIVSPNRTEISFLIILCSRCHGNVSSELLPSNVLSPLYTADTKQWLFLWLHSLVWTNMPQYHYRVKQTKRDISPNLRRVVFVLFFLSNIAS